MSYDPQALQSKYQQVWHDQKVYEPDLLSTHKNQKAPKPYYNLMMFPYPSAEGLHVGNMYAFTGADVHGRFRRMQGYDVFEPIGLDGFGIHSENYAIKVGKHPQQQAKISEENFYRQLSLIGNGFAWDERLETYDPEYYRWTQWLFIQMFKKGLAYKGTARVNWCPSCKTVLADEQVEDGRCERCKSEVERREMSSWYFKITNYADRLLGNIDGFAWTDKEGQKHTGLDWPNKVTMAQKNWIGRKDGLAIDFAVSNNQNQKTSPAAQSLTNLTVWTTYWETLFGATYLVVAPEYPQLADLVTPEQKQAVDTYVEQALNKSEQERKIGRDKTGVFTGTTVINPATGQEIPVWVADYVLTDVGTGAVMGVPAHDERDFAFAKRFELPIIQVVEYSDPEVNAKVAAAEQAYEAEGKLLHSAVTNGPSFDGQSAWGEGKQTMKEWMLSAGFAREQIHYHLRDWLISRQRYWGPPIPLVFCEDCAKQGRGERPELPGWYAVAETQLPVLLPHLENFKPVGDGTSPLDNAEDSWKFTTCPHCGGQAKRETDVSDTFLDSSWYFLRYPCASADGVAPKQDADKHPFPQVEAGKASPGQPTWFPVDAYIGGAEHAVLHLLYARFVTMALHDWGYLPSEEPFPYLFGHGLIIKDGAKMSKSRGNVVNPDDYIAKFGADALRSYLMFLGPYDQGGDFRDTGMHGMNKWLNKVWETVVNSHSDQTTPALKQKLHQTIATNTQDMAQLKFNTCLARLMEVINLWRDGTSGQAATMSDADVVVFLQLLAPFAPYLTEELFQTRHESGKTTNFQSIHSTIWPTADSQYLVVENVTIAVQINGKLRATFQMGREEAKNESAAIALARELSEVERFCQGKQIKKSIYIPGKIINFVV
jgi:leucyl-tRNA synthetase